MKSRRLIFGPSSQGRFAGYRIGGDQSAGARASGSASGCRLGERCAGPTQPRDHPQILAIPYLFAMIVGRAVESSKRQSLPQGICGAHAAEHWCGNTDSRITTGIEVGRIRRVRLSLRDGWSNCSYSKSEPGQKGPTRQSRRRRDRSFGAQHLEIDSSPVGCHVQSAVSRGFPTVCRGKTWRPELGPACVAEFPQPAHKSRAPKTEQFTACTLRIAPNDSEPFIVLHVYLHPAERIQRRAARPGSLSGQRRSLLIASSYGAGGLGCARASSLAVSACHQGSCRRAIERVVRF